MGQAAEACGLSVPVLRSATLVMPITSAYTTALIISQTSTTILSADYLSTANWIVMNLWQTSVANFQMATATGSQSGMAFLICVSWFWLGLCLLINSKEKFQSKCCSPEPTRWCEPCPALEESLHMENQCLHHATGMSTLPYHHQT